MPTNPRKHTPGPFKLIDGDDARKGDWYLDDRHNWIKLESDPGAGLKYHFVRFEIAVRRLMAPAEQHGGELLEALKELMEWTAVESFELHPDWPAYEAKYRAAIAKAEGKNN